MIKRLKTDLHLHTKDDRQDCVVHSSEELIDEAARQGYEVISITNHDKVTYTPALADYAREKGILLIPGCEAKIREKHVLLYNFPQGYKSFEQIRENKDKDNLVIAPHPYYPAQVSLNRILERHLNTFDAIEYCHYHHKWINFNKRAVDLSQKKEIPLVGTSDAHHMFQLGLTYSIIEAEKNMVSVFEAIKKGKIEIFTRPLSFRQLMLIQFQPLFRQTIRENSDRLPLAGPHLPPPVKLQIG
jgi:predicted metal-dependent phosphoesterase TrpH